MSDPFQQNINGVKNLVESKINKISIGASSQQEGVVGEKIDELELNLSDEELLALSKKWETQYAPYEAKIRLRQQENLKYYLGKQKEDTIYATEDGKGISANFLFEAVETFLPAALSKNPEPVVWSDNSPAGNAIAESVKTMLQYHSDTLALRPKLSQMTRKWTVDLLGVLKHGWDNEISDIKTEVRDVKKFIFDISGYVNVYGEFVGYLGERITVTAERLIEMFPENKSYIVVLTDGKLGTPVTYTEWWTDEYCFYTFKGKVLDKHKNPHFNYDKEEPATENNDAFINPGHNFFAKPKKPYTFFSVFSVGEEPYDLTGLVEQNIPNQRLISRRVEQIDYNISRANNSTILSGNNFTQETGKQFAVARIKGHPALVPAGAPLEQAVKDMPAVPLPAQFFKDFENNVENLRSIFGTAGITSSAQDNDETARGMILKQQYDNSRIGGGIGEALERVAKNVFNWWTQMYYVYYDEPHFAAVMGQMQATQYIELSAKNLNAKLIVSVAPDSMKPHDEVTDMNQALSLWEAQAIDPLTLLTRLHFPNAKEVAGQYMAFKLYPQMYFQMNWPDIAQQIQQGMMAQNPQPTAPGIEGNPQVANSAPHISGGVEANSALNQVALPK